MKQLFSFVERLSRFGGIASAVCILLITGLILVEILVRSIFGSSTFVAEEYSAYLMADFAFLGLAYTLRSGGHIRVNLVLSKCRAKGRTVLRFLSCLIGTVVFAIMTYELGALTLDSFTTGEVSMNITRTRLFIPQLGLVIGSAMMAIQLLAMAGEYLLPTAGGHPESSDPSEGE